MAVFKGYFDDSQTTGQLWAVAGYVGGDHRWDAFEERWQKALDKHEVPYFHMREMGDPDGVYKKWHPLEDHNSERAVFFADLIAALKYCRLEAFASIVRIPELNRFNAEFGLALEPFPLAAFGCMVLLANEYNREPSQLFFDSVEKIGSKLDKAREYADSDRVYSGDFDVVATSQLPKGMNAKNVRGMQAADFAVWELRTHHLKQVADWFAIEEKPRDVEARWAHFQQWSQQKYGQDRPPMRRSAEELLKTGIHNLVWSYDQLCTANELRGGVWA